MAVRQWQRALGLVLAGMSAWPAIAIGGAAPATAASGGGCNGPVAGNTWSGVSSCISAPFRGVGRPDGYVRLSANHPACTINVVALRAGGGEVLGTFRSYPCPAGASDRRYAGGDFSASSGTFLTLVTIRGYYSVYSKRITLP